jgi:hypothetical protein
MINLLDIISLRCKLNLFQYDILFIDKKSELTALELMEKDPEEYAY